MRITIKQLESELKEARERSYAYKYQLDLIHDLIFPSYPRNAIRKDINNIVLELAKIIAERNCNGGLVIPRSSNTVNLLKEIIRWQINPETAMEQKAQVQNDLL